MGALELTSQIPTVWHFSPADAKPPSQTLVLVHSISVSSTPLGTNLTFSMRASRSHPFGLLCGAVAGRTKMISGAWYAAVMQRDGQFAAGGDGKTSRRCLEGMRQVGHDDHWSSAKNVQWINTWIHEHRTCCRASEPGSPRMSPDPKAEEDIQVRFPYIQGDGPRDMQ